MSMSVLTSIMRDHWMCTCLCTCVLVDNKLLHRYDCFLIVVYIVQTLTINTHTP